MSYLVTSHCQETSTLQVKFLHCISAHQGDQGESSILKLGAVHKLRLQEEGGRGSKKLTFCKLLYHRKCKQRGVGGQKKTNLVNVVCERPLIIK